MKTIYKHMWFPAAEDEDKILREQRDRGWLLVSHSIYYVKKTMMISFIFSKLCDCIHCDTCPDRKEQS